jgi:predicted  nucleic acid-binding Zn-ribbon protein
MELDVVYQEFDKQFEGISNRLVKIEEKIDAQVERDHSCELKIQKLELAVENIRMESQEEKKIMRPQLEKVSKDLDKSFSRIREVEQTPDTKKAKMVNRIIDRSVSYIIDAILAAGVAYFAVQFLSK